MATGIVKGEKLSPDALLADSAKTESYPLPAPDDQVSLTYPNKMTKGEILRQVEHTFSLVGKNGKYQSVTKIEPNAFLLTDNFFGMKKLLEQFKGKVTLIYFDPPYGTGLEFQSRGLKHAYKDILGAAPWLEFIRRRLILMHELLSDDGSIYVHIGHQMLFHLKIIMDEVFGINRFLNLIVRKKCSSKNYTRNQYPNLNDYLLFYSKNGNYKWNKPSLPAKQDWIEKEYPKRDSKGPYKLVPIHAPGVRKGETGKTWKGMNPPPGKHWQLVPSKLDELDAAGEIHWSRTGNPRRKVYLLENKELPLTDYWEQFRDAHHQSIKITGYPTEKNIDMLRKIIEGSSNKGDLVLDPFCGSGSTLEAARDLERRWIGIDQSFTAAEATLKRLRHGSEPMGDYVNSNNGNDKLKSPPNPGLFDKEIIKERNDFCFIADSDVINRHPLELKALASI